MPTRSTPFIAGECYHLYNRGHNRERIFFEPENYPFFLRRLREHLTPVMDVVAYCLMPTHYHLLVQIKSPETSEVLKTSEVSGAVSNAVRRLAISYTKAMNRRYDRVGTLFQGAFQAKQVTKDEYLLHLSRYIHLNPVLTGLVSRPEGWEYSSYPETIGLRGGTLPRPEIVLAQFPSPETYREFVESYRPDDKGQVVGLLFDED